MIILSKLLYSPFNEWLRENGIYIAISIAALLIVIVATIILISKKKGH